MYRLLSGNSFTVAKNLKLDIKRNVGIILNFFIVNYQN